MWQPRRLNASRTPCSFTFAKVQHRETHIKYSVGSKLGSIGIAVSHPRRCVKPPPPSRPYTLLYISGTRHEAVNIFRTRNNRITTYVPTLYKTYCFALQKRRFCTVKAAVLQRKTYAFASPNRNYRFSSEVSLQKWGTYLKPQGRNIGNCNGEFWNCDTRILKLRCKNFETAMQGFLSCHKKIRLVCFTAYESHRTKNII